MDQLHLLLLLSFSMLVGSFFSGTVPMAFKLSDSKSRLLALLGSGILVGTALAIIIPEGIDSLYAQTDPLIGNQIPLPAAAASGDKAAGSVSESSADAGSKQLPILQPDGPAKVWTIGVSLVVGFVLMLLIDQFSLYQTGGASIHHHSPASGGGHLDYSLASQEDDIDVGLEEEEDIAKVTDDLETTSEAAIDTRPYRVSMRHLDNNTNGNSSSQVELYSNNNRQQQHRLSGPRASTNTKVTPTLGLVIHAAADGIALGAAATTSHREVEMIIFLAIMLHKAPAAFSLVVFLLHRGLKHSTIRKHLLAFSLSAPLAALLTYFGLSQSGKEALRRNNATGIAMLFSAGTFLYVATVHVLPELVNDKLLTPKELLFLVGGAFLPILLAQTI